MHRVLIAPQALHDESLAITDSGALHHLLDVLRLDVGDRLECFDGQGHSYAGVIVQRARRQLIVAIDHHAVEPPPSVRMILAQALIRPERFEWTIQKATELAVAHIIPMVSSRTTTRLSSSHNDSRLARWRRIIEAAATQCGRATLPTIEAPQPFERVLQRFSGRYTLLPTLSEESTPLERHLAGLQSATEAVILIGPEGDFSIEEVALAKRCGARPVRLGRFVLRSETAAIAVLAVLQHAVGVL